MKKFHRSLVIGCSMLALSACGPEDIASPGTGSVTINTTTNNTTNNPPPTPAPTPTPTPTGTPTPTPTPGPTYTAAAACPTIADPQGLTDGGAIIVPDGTVRVCVLPATFNVSSTLVDTPDGAKVVYEIAGRVDVGADGGPAPDASDGLSDSNVTLTAEAGVVLFGGVGNAHLVVNRGSDISAIGSAASPIIFTSRQNILGNTTDTSEGQWGGLILLGRGPIADCADGGATGGTVACETQVEGPPLAALYGGATAADNSGTLRYVQLRYSGFALSPDNELQSLTTGGVGSGTTLEYIQSVNSSDDGVEFFGGHVNIRYLVINGAGDDALDTDSGGQINMQWVIASQRTATGNGIIEADSGGGGNDLPRQDTRIANATFIASSTVADAAAIRLRGGTDFALANIVMDASAMTGRQCLDIDDAETLQGAGTEEDGAPFFASVFMECPGGVAYTVDGNEVATEAAFDATSNALWTGGTAKNDAFTATLTSMFVNGANEIGATSFNPTVFNRNGFSFDNPGYVGGASAADNWYKVWTCNSNIGALSGATDCADSPFA